MEYKITLEVVKHFELGEIQKLFITYYGGKFDGLREYYGRSKEAAETEIREGYLKNKDSL